MSVDTTSSHIEQRLWSRLTYGGPSLDELYRDYAMQHRIDSHAPITATREATVDARIGRVWHVLSQVEHWGQVHPNVSDVRNDEGVVGGAPSPGATDGQG
jgi:hypothetical protein